MNTDRPRPARVCQSLLAALAASEGRSHARKRDQTPDAIGLCLRRALLERVARADPAPEDFEQWLLDHTADIGPSGSMRAIARSVFEDWQLAQYQPSFAAWLEHGAPSDDTPACARATPSSEGRHPTPGADGAAHAPQGRLQHPSDSGVAGAPVRHCSPNGAQDG